MSVIINGMDMPKVCQECPMYIYDMHFDGDEWHHGCDLHDEEVYDEVISEHCPLRPMEENK